MSVTWGATTVTGPHAQAHIPIGTPVRGASRLGFALLAGAAFGLYWYSSLVLQARNATTHFGADAHVYALLAQGTAVDGLTRFHPMTIALALTWMKITSPLALWVAPAHLLKAMFAAVGAVGVRAAMSAFAAVMPCRCAMLFGIIYGISLGVWYCSGIEESKIVTATLSALYIATYLQRRKNWTGRGAVLLTAILMAACLNEIAVGLLVVIPAVDTLAQRGFDVRHGWWVAVHALAAPVALAILEFIVNGPLVAAETTPSRASHLSMLIYYISQNNFSAANFYSFVVEWLFFNIAAPTPNASYGANLWLNFAGTFEPALASYFYSPVSASLVALTAGMLVASVLPRYRTESANNVAGILWALTAYVLLRGMFFFIYLPNEPLLNSAAVTLAHLLLIGIPFTASSFPAKRMLLGAFAVLLFVTNGVFIMGL